MVDFTKISEMASRNGEAKLRLLEGKVYVDVRYIGRGTTNQERLSHTSPTIIS